MKVGILQFAPELRLVQKNIARADALLLDVHSGDFQLLVLPELAFSGYNFPSTASIQPYLEPTANGPTAAWARSTAARLECLVSVGYPELSSEPTDSGVSAGASVSGTSPGKRYNSMLTVAPDGSLVAHYRKTNLYYTDATWSWPNPTGFKTIDLKIPAPSTNPNGLDDNPFPLLTRATFAICMDFNPKQFKAPWTDYELAMHVLRTNANLVIASNAWLTHSSREELEATPEEFDADTLSYWVARLEPLVEERNARGLSNPETREGQSPSEERILVIANRVGIEPGICKACDLTTGRPLDDGEVTDVGDAEALMSIEGQAAKSGEPTPANPADTIEPGSGIVATEARYAGSSCVLGVCGDGTIKVYGLCGQAEEKLLVVDTNEQPLFLAGLVNKVDRTSTEPSHEAKVQD